MRMYNSEKHNEEPMGFKLREDYKTFKRVDINILEEFLSKEAEANKEGKEIGYTLLFTE